MLKLKTFVAIAAFTAVNLAAFADIEVNPIPDHPDWGYTVTEFPDAPDDIAIVFTNHNPETSMFWKMPHGADNVQFLVVGGGGGGGGAWGPGGGGGGVVTGMIHRLSKNISVDVIVGEGGARGTSNVGADANPGKKGTDSVISINKIEYVVAYAGGASGAKNTKNKSGGSGAGGVPSESISYGGSATKGYFDSTYIAGEAFGNYGGTNVHKSVWHGAGGGGALEAGGNTRDGSKGGHGGEGLACAITGISVVYGSGGGGGGSASSDRGLGGENAGNGGYYNSANKDQYLATAGKANTGGGGGGGGRNYGDYVKGGAGGSGIVVIRYRQKPPVFKIIVR